MTRTGLLGKRGTCDVMIEMGNFGELESSIFLFKIV